MKTLVWAGTAPRAVVFHHLVYGKVNADASCVEQLRI
jgi:hypothetical protein